jgi:proline iminopeptidase
MYFLKACMTQFANFCVVIYRGPGGGIGERDRRYFDPKAYHAVLFDQRGAGKSTPSFCLEENDTWSLVEDMEKLR